MKTTLKLMALGAIIAGLASCGSSPAATGVEAIPYTGGTTIIDQK